MKKLKPGEFDFATHNHEVRKVALRAFQQRYRARRYWKACGVLAALAACIMAFQTSRHTETARSMVHSPPPPAPPPFEQPDQVDAANLTDEQLIALFPPGSCWMAEIDGHKKLIFADETLHRRLVED